MARFVCGMPDCTFQVESDDEDEIVEHAGRHAREKHGEELDEQRIRGRIAS